MHLDVTLRTQLVDTILYRLVDAVPNSAAELRGSLADGSTDQYSDIDVLWEVPESEFETSIGEIAETLSLIGPLDSLRVDPEFLTSKNRRLLFIRFACVPLFWRLNLEVTMIAERDYTDTEITQQVAQPQDVTWSESESALASAVAAIKSLAREQEEQAMNLLQRAYARLNLEMPDDPPVELMLLLTQEAVHKDPYQHQFAARIRSLLTELFVT